MVPQDLIAGSSLSETNTNWRFGGRSKQETFSIHTDGPLQYKTLNLQSDLYQYRFEFPEGILTLVAEPKEFTASLIDFSLDEETIQISLEVNADFDLSSHESELILARRSNPQLYLYFEQEQIFQVPARADESRTISFSLPLADLKTLFLVDNSNTLDAFFRFKNQTSLSKKVFIEISDAAKQTASKKIFIKSKPFTSLESYVTGSNRLSFYFRKELAKEAQLTQLKEEKDLFHLSFFFKEALANPRLILKRRDKKFSTSEYTLETEFAIKKGLRSYSAEIFKSEFYPLHTFQPSEIWDAFVRSDGRPDFPVFVPNQVDVMSDYKAISGGKYQLRTQKTMLSNLSFHIVASPSSKQTSAKKLAIFGSVSDAAFDTGVYFNPNAPAFFDIVFVQKNTSLISVMSEKYQASSALSASRAAETSEQDWEHVRHDIEKDFFARLREAKPDYLLLDLFADVCRPVLWLNDKSALSYSKAVEESGLADQLSFDRLVSHQNNDAYYKEWRRAARSFLAKLVEIVPEERIILNRGGTTLTYLDAGRKVANYRNKMGIQHEQYFWDRLNNFVLSILPNARVIDFSSKKYMGDIFYPQGHSYTTFERNYYKDFLKEMIYLVDANND
ncbi:hypothetical protein MFLO_13468 [Listeria floridensis FSL S10-1187]|uniref:Teichoic acid biosynthesis protein n=1 Tax=Listeria floridensis FSL S10-1187 TaxID=1265817 RepID=A0ABP3AVF6_9LIST|nr:DUF6270 domain-containing protein [Listeria floridensis]EUJ27469.1 hypothetical protein MFLO_13468 [Listeria floridensis FSL S10-1187]